MKGVHTSGILRVAALLLAAGGCDAHAGAAFEQLSARLTIVDACTVSSLDRVSASDAVHGGSTNPVRVACSGGAAPAVTFARVPRAMAFATAGLAPPAGEGVFRTESESESVVGDPAIVRATVTF